MTDLLLIRITCPSQRVAEDIGDAAVEHKLAACANLEGPVSSTYRWKAEGELGPDRGACPHPSPL